MRARVERLLAVVRRIVGAPDYAEYLRHMRSRHPERRPLTETEFRDERLEARYSRPGSRCC